MMLIMKKKFHNWLDSLGFSLSMLCALHCLFFPVLLVILPIFGMNFLLNATAEKAFVVGSVIMAAISICWGYKIHKRWKALLLYVAGAILLISATFFMNHSHVHSSSIPANEYTVSISSFTGNAPQNNYFSLILLVLGGLGIASSHLLNKRLCNSCHAHQH